LPTRVDTTESLAFDGARLAVLTDTVVCVDPPSEARTCFRYGMDAEIPDDLRVGDEVVVVTIDGRVDRIEHEPLT